MRSHRFSPLNVVFITLAAACASSGPPREPADNKTLTAEEIAKRGDEPIEVMLQRKFPGIQVYRNSDGDITLQIRGATTTSGAPKQPLYVINDMEFEPGGQGLQSIVNPYDIESIKVLKGPETAIYGIRGADGVIVIKTKKPVKKEIRPLE